MRPEIKEGLDRYATQGIPTGGFLQAVLENDLMEAFGRADEGNIYDMFEIVGYVYNKLPGICHGSPAKVTAWLKRFEHSRWAMSLEPGHLVAYAPPVGDVEIGEVSSVAKNAVFVLYHLGDTAANTAPEDLVDLPEIYTDRLKDRKIVDKRNLLVTRFKST